MFCGGGEGSFLAVIDEGGLAGVIADQHESAAAQVAGGGMDDGQRKSGGDGGVDRVAALLQDLDTGIGREVMHADHHAVARADGLAFGVGGGGAGGLLGGECGRKCGDREEGGGAKVSACRYRRMAPHHGAARITLPRAANGSR